MFTGPLGIPTSGFLVQRFAHSTKEKLYKAHISADLRCCAELVQLLSVLA